MDIIMVHLIVKDQFGPKTDTSVFLPLPSAVALMRNLCPIFLHTIDRNIIGEVTAAEEISSVSQ